MKKNNLKVIKIGKVLFNYEKKIIIKDLTLDLKLGYFDFEKDPFGNEIYLNSDTPIDFRLLERNVGVSVSLR